MDQCRGTTSEQQLGDLPKRIHHRLEESSTSTSTTSTTTSTTTTTTNPPPMETLGRNFEKMAVSSANGEGIGARSVSVSGPSG